jgi:ubiquinone/menaquinone biosynthesis C-methylase UbiE
MSHQFDPTATMIFMNYGFASLEATAPKIHLQTADEVNRYNIQFYHHLAHTLDLAGCRVLEVGSGRGGGASYIMRYLRPLSVTGVDIANNAVEFCRSHHQVKGLQFVQGNAESLQFEDNTFDVIVNLESSHGYGSVPDFLREVRRVLKPRGHFVFADWRERKQAMSLRQQILGTGLEVVKEEDVTANVVHALELDVARKHEFIRDSVPRMWRGIFAEFSGLPHNSSFYDGFKSRQKLYVHYILRQPG